MTTYQRGTKTTKVTTASLQPGTVLLTTGADQGDLSRVRVADKKTGAVLRTVDHVERVAPGQYERTVRIVVHFTDDTYSQRCAPSQTWMTTEES